MCRIDIGVPSQRVNINGANGQIARVRLLLRKVITGFPENDQFKIADPVQNEGEVFLP